MSQEHVRTFLTSAFLIEVEPGLFGLYRSIEQEEFDRKKMKPVREKLKNVGPIALFRECKEGESIDMTTFHPVSKKPLSLTKVS
jgi:hypothetical protein